MMLWISDCRTFKSDNIPSLFLTSNKSKNKYINSVYKEKFIAEEELSHSKLEV